MDDAIGLHSGEWLLMKVTGFDEDGLPSRGQIIAHSKSHARVCNELIKIGAGGESGDRFYLFQAYPRIRTGEELRRAIAEAWRTGAAGAWRTW